MSARVLRWYGRARAAVDTSAAGARALVDGVFLGLFDADDLEQLDRRYYDAQPEYVDDAYNLGGLLGWEERFTDQHVRPGMRAVVIGAGGGREVVALLRRGVDVDAYEPHDGLRAAANSLLESLGLPAVVQPMTRTVWPAVEPGAHVVVIGWGTFMLIPGREARCGLLTAARSWLRPDGLLLVSAAARRADRRLRALQLVADLVARLRGGRRIELGDALAPNFVHLFTAAELHDEVHHGGFVVVDVGRDPDDSRGPYLYAVGQSPADGGALVPSPPATEPEPREEPSWTTELASNRA